MPHMKEGGLQARLLRRFFQKKKLKDPFICMEIEYAGIEVQIDSEKWLIKERSFNCHFLYSPLFLKFCSSWEIQVLKIPMTSK